ncbi:MAG: response regulator receiver [Gammaproteobacteria bacterium]|nr:MAG: response regulator receiver [Gammaproteobacteria bacterium]TND02279.1 MAG: response regulator receiver, CheY-like protein [Gammaproteobacteria bacterium]
MTHQPAYSLLLVDDNEMNRDMVSRSLARSGYLVATAAGGPAALEMMGVEGFDLVLLDLMMPEMDGYRVLEIMRESERLRAMPVMVVSAISGRQSMAKCLALGACDYVVKPSEMDVLKARIWRSLEYRRYARPQEESASEPEPVGGRVLLVEDNEANLDILKRRLVQWSCVVDCAGDGLEAIERIAGSAGGYDLILLDIAMPKMDGFEVLRFIKSSPRYNHIAVIMVSALDDSGTIMRALEMGADDFVRKPFNAVELNIRVQSCIRAKKLRDQCAAWRERLKGLS